MRGECQLVSQRAQRLDEKRQGKDMRSMRAEVRLTPSVRRSGLEKLGRWSSYELSCWRQRGR